MNTTCSVVHTWKLDTLMGIQSAARPTVTFSPYMAMFDSLFGPSRGPRGGATIQLTRPTQYQFQNKQNVFKRREFHINIVAFSDVKYTR